MHFFTEEEETRLEKIWEVDSDNHKEQLPKLCNGFMKPNEFYRTHQKESPLPTIISLKLACWCAGKGINWAYLVILGTRLIL